MMCSAQAGKAGKHCVWSCELQLSALGLRSFAQGGAASKVAQVNDLLNGVHTILSKS